MLGVALFAVARVPRPGPRREHQQQAGIAGRPDLVTLLGNPVRDGPDPCGLGVAALLELYLSVDHYEVGVLMDLVLLELLAGGQKDRDRAGCSVIGAQDLRLMR